MIEIVFPFRLPGLNDYVDACRRNAHTGAKMKKDAQEDCEWVIRMTPSVRALLCQLPQGGAEKRADLIKEPVVLHFTFIEPNKRRDPDNISGFAHKVIFDALVSQGVLSGDGWKGVRGYSDEFQCVKGKSEIILVIEEEK